MNQRWQKSSYCSEGSSCIHVSASPTGKVKLTESADPTGVILAARPTAFAALIRKAKEADHV
ncbi:DUF397 domain-containing protein [Streptomyces sp. NPDC127108]|uniref:DUF397 domain-containing protein n=1 Tax=Streptomyces sp. NPDC127108 TaxID=3345361 RepID=UPI00363EDFF0